MKREIVAGIIALILVFGLVGVVSATTEFIDTAQYNADIEDLWSFDHIINPDPYYCSGSTDWYYTTFPSAYYKSVYLYARADSNKCVCVGKCYLYARMKSSHQSNYFSFDMRDMTGIFYVGGHSSVAVYLVTYDSDGDITNRYVIGSISGSGAGGGDYVYTYQNNHLFEFNVESNQMYILIDGDSKGSLGSYSESKSPYYWGIELYVYAGMSCGCPEYDSYASMKMWFDDVTTGDGIVGVGHESNPLHTITELTNYDLDTSWHVKTVPSADYTSGQYDLKVKRATWGEWYNVTNLKEAGNSSAKPSGFIVYNWSELFNVDDYGLYWFSIYKDDTEIAKDWLFFKDIGEDSYINIEETEYAIGSPMNISYYIGDPDFGANDYWIYMYDSSGSKMDELELFEQAATHEFTSTIDWEVGTCYAVLVEDTAPSIDMDPPTDIIDLAYDFAWLTDAIYIRGYTWDATNPDNLVDGTLLTNVSVNFTHNDDEYNATSDASGYYEFIDPVTSEEMEFYMDISVQVNASKTGYTHDNFTTEIIRAGTYYIDLYLVPSERDVNQDNSSIAGLVLDLPFHQAIPQATVHIENATWSNTTTTNTWGYYIFDYEFMNNSVGLGNNTYDMWATKETFSGTSKEEVQAHDVVYTLDNCDTVDFYEATLDECDSLTNNGYWGYASIYNESFNSSTCNSSWVQLNHVDLRSSSEAVTNTTQSFVKDTDYKMNYTDGRVQIICTGGMENDTSYNISYQYEIGNPNVVNTTDYVETTGSLEATGNKTIDFMKTFTTPVDANVSKEHGYFYFYSKVLDKTNISSTNITVIIGSNGDNTTDTITWGVNKANFGSTWNLTILTLKAGEESGTCDLSAINYFELKSTKTGNVTAKIDDIRFIEYAGWESDLELSADTGDKMEGTASVNATGNKWIEYPYYHWNETKEYYVTKWFGVPFDAGAISKTGDLSRLEFWYKPAISAVGHDIVLASNETVDYMYWNNIGGTGNTWGLHKLYLTDAYENQSLNISGIKWFVLFGMRWGLFDITEKLDNIQLKEVGRTYHNFYMDEYYDLTVHAKEMETHNTITDFKAVWDSTNVKETTDGTIIFTNITYGIYALEVTADGFYTSKQYIFMGQDTEETVYLLKIEEGVEGGVGSYYPPPHLVEFRVQTWQGVPISDVNVTVKGYSTTMGAWGWVYSIFGYKNETQIHNITMSDTTDSNGGISFLMIETVKYEMTFLKGSEVNETIFLYPKEDHYKIIIGTHWVETSSMWDTINYSMLAGELNDTHAYINFSYVDGDNKTSEVYYFITQTNGTESFNIYNYTYTGGDCANIFNSQVVKRGEVYLIGFVGQNDNFGEIKASVFTRIFEKGKRLLEFENCPAYMYDYIAIGLLCLTGAFFGVITVPEGGVVICLEAWILFFLGWLSFGVVLMPLYLTVATVLAILVVFAAKGRQKGIS